MCVVCFNQFAESTGGCLLIHSELILSHARNLNKHWSDQVDAFKELDVYLEVVRDLPFFLFSFEFLWFFKASRDFLGDKLSVAWMLADFIKDLVGLFNFAETELGETDLDKGSIVKNLVVDWLYSYNLGHLCFK